MIQQYTNVFTTGKDEIKRNQQKSQTRKTNHYQKKRQFTKNMY